MVSYATNVKRHNKGCRLTVTGAVSALDVMAAMAGRDCRDEESCVGAGAELWIDVAAENLQHETRNQHVRCNHVIKSTHIPSTSAQRSLYSWML